MTPARAPIGGNRSLRPWGAAIGETVNVQRGRRSAGCAHRPHPSTGRFHGLNRPELYGYRMRRELVKASAWVEVRPWPVKPGMVRSLPAIASLGWTTNRRKSGERPSPRIDAGACAAVTIGSTRTTCPSACRHRSRGCRCEPPFFSAFHTLTVDDAGRGAGFARGFLAALEVERMMDAIQRAVPVHRPR